MSHVPSVGHLSHMGHWAVGPATRDETPWNVPIPGCSVSFQGPTFLWPMYHQLAIRLTQDTRVWAHLVETGHQEWDHSKVFCVIQGAHIPVSHVPSVGHLSHMGHWGVGPVTQDETPGNVPIPGCFVSFQGPASPCPMYHRSAIGHTQDPGMWAHPVQTGHLEWDHSMVFHVIPGAGIPVSHVLSVDHWSQTGHWDVHPATQDGTTWNAMCSVLFQGLTLLCPMYHCSAICLTWDTGLWAQQLETKHPGMFPSQGVPCHSRGPHSHGPCTIGQPSVLHGTLGCGPPCSRWDAWNGIIPRCSVSFQGPASPCPMYYGLAIGLTRDTGVWAQPLEMDHPGIGSFQGVPCHSRGPHPHVPCTIGWSSILHRTMGCGVTASRRNTLVWDNSRVFYAIPGAHILVSHIRSVGHHHGTLGRGPTALRWNTLKLSHSRVFCAPQGAHIAVSRVPTVGRRCRYWLLVPVISNSVGGRYQLSVSVLEVGISRPCRCQMHNHRTEHTWI